MKCPHCKEKLENWVTKEELSLVGANCKLWQELVGIKRGKQKK